jgi:hypothetical protein
MTAQEVLNGNKLIAEFMGYVYIGGSGLFYVDSNKQAWAIERVQFHSSWDWLMPVVEKIESMERKYDTDSKISFRWRVEIKRQTCYIQYCFTGKGKELLIDANTKIEAVWVAVVEFIKWFKRWKC